MAKFLLVCLAAAVAIIASTAAASHSKNEESSYIEEISRTYDFKFGPIDQILSQLEELNCRPSAFLGNIGGWR